MSLVWSERLDALERMDTEALSPEDARRILKALELVNRWLGGADATLSWFKGFSKKWQAGERIRIIDWGTGGADIPRALINWSRPRGYRLEVFGVDNNPAVLDEAHRLCASYPEIHLIQTDLASFPEKADFDYAISSLCLHHLKDSDIISLLLKSDRVARRGVVFNDLIRSARAWAWIWGLTHVMGAHPVVKNDAPLSVQRAFTVPEMKKLIRQSQLSYLSLRRHFGYRFTIGGERE